MRNKLKLDILITLLFTVLKPFAFLFVIPIISSSLTPSALGLYFLVRRTASTGGALLQLGGSQTLMRALSVARSTNEKALYIFIAFVFFVFVLLGVFVAVFFFEDELLSIAFANKTVGLKLLYGLAALTMAYVLNYLIMSILIAYRYIFTLNVMQIMVNSGFILICLTVYAFDISVEKIVFFEAMSIVALCVFLVAYLFFRGNLGFPKKFNGWLDVLKTYRDYGVIRGVTSGLDMMLFLIGSWLMVFDLRQVGYFIIALVLFKVVQSLVLPVGQLSGVIMSKWSSEKEKLETGVSFLVGVPAVVLPIVTASIYPWLNGLLNVWLDASTAAGVLPYLEIVIWGALPYALYQGLYVSIDMLWSRPVNFVFLVTSLLGYVIIFYFAEPMFGAPFSVALAFLVAVTFLGIGSVLMVSRYLSPLKGLEPLRLLVLALIAYGANIGFVKLDSMFSVPLALILLCTEFYYYVFFAPSKYVSFVKNVYSDNRGT